MTKARYTKGVALYLVIASLLVALVLSSVILRTILNQTRLTHHMVSRIRAYYASFGAVNYAFAMLRAGTWPVPSSGTTATYTICHTGALGVCSCTYCDNDIVAYPISNIIITFDNTATATGPNSTLRVSASSTYTYIPDVY